MTWSEEIRADRSSPRTAGLRALGVDAALAVVVLLIELGPVIGDAPPWAFRPLGLLDAVRLGGFTLPLLLRRRWPVAVMAVQILSFAGSDLLGPGLLLGFYSVGAWEPRSRVSRIAAGAGALAVAVEFVANRQVDFTFEVLIAPAIFLAAWYLGDLSRVRREYTKVLEEKAQRLEAEREAEIREVAAAERARLARELHDIVAHRVSIMTVQAGAAGVVAESDPAAAREAISAVEETGRDALCELRCLLNVLRTDDEAASIRPQPSLDRLHEVVDAVRAAGVPVHVSMVGQRPNVPATVELSAYRIVQEALTNVIKHAGDGAEADVTLRFVPGVLEISVADTGRGPRPNSDGGHGLVGMRERAAAFGGTVESGPRAGGGFEVKATLPFREPGA